MRVPGGGGEAVPCSCITVLVSGGVGEADSCARGLYGYLAVGGNLLAETVGRARAPLWFRYIFFLDN